MNGIVADGAKRLRTTIEAEVRREFAEELAKATNSFWKRRMIQKTINEEVKRRMNQFGSPHSLYFSRKIGLLK